MDDPADRLALHHFSGGDAAKFRLRRQVASVHHAEWLVELTRDKVLKRRFRHSLHHLAQHEEIDVAVTEARPRFRLDGFGAGLLDRCCLATPITSRLNARPQT